MPVYAADNFGEVPALKHLGEGLRRLLVGRIARVRADSAAHLMFPQVQDTVRESLGLPGDFGGNPRLPQHQPRASGGQRPPVLLRHVVAEDAAFLGIVLEQRTDGVVRRNAPQPDHFRLHQFLVNAAAIAKFGDVALGLLQQFQEFRLQSPSEQLAEQLQGAAGILDDLDGLDAGQLVEEPAAAGVHQHGVALHFEQLQQAHAFRLVELAVRGGGEEPLHRFGRTVEDHGDVAVAGPPRIDAETACGIAIGRGNRVAQPVERRPQRFAPLLAPARPSPGTAAAVTPPAFDPVDAAPRAVLEDLDFVRGFVIL